MTRDKRRTNASAPPRHGLLGSLLDDANAILQSVANEVAPVVVGAIDVDGVVQQIDIQEIVDKVDVQAILDRVDIQALVEGLDIQAIIDHVDIGKVLENVDLNVVLERVDLDRLLDRIDVNKIMLRLDPSVVIVLLNLLLPQLDMNAVVARLDFDQIVERIDVNAIIERVDIDQLVERTELGAIVARASSSVASDVIDSARSAGVGLDSFVQSLGRPHPPPPRCVPAERPRASHPRARTGDAMTVRVEPDRDVSLQGHYAGIVTRLAAFGIDVLVATTLFTLGGNVVEYLLSSLLGKDVSLSDAPVVSVVAIAAWLARLLRVPHLRWRQNPGNGTRRIGGRHQGRSPGRRRACCASDAVSPAQPDLPRDRHSDGSRQPSTACVA